MALPVRAVPLPSSAPSTSSLCSAIASRGTTSTAPAFLASPTASPASTAPLALFARPASTVLSTQSLRHVTASRGTSSTPLRIPAWAAITVAKSA